MTNKDKLLHKIVALIKPPRMSHSEYVLHCAIRTVDVSLNDPMYMHWIIKEAYNDSCSKKHQKVRNLIITGLKQHLILDFTKDIDCSYISELLPDIVMRESLVKDETEKLFSVLLEEYRHTQLGEVAYRLNKAFGFTSTCYFS